MIYLDHSATTPIAPEALAAMAQAAAEFPGNPSSVHGAGRRARAALESARARLAACLGAHPDEIVLTASGSEANNLALKGALLARAPRPAHLVVSAIEHDSLLRAARAMAARFDWVHLTEVAPETDGRVRPEAIASALRPETCLVALMHANNETGTVQPVAEVAALARRYGALYHTDAVQTLGRRPLDVNELGCDLLALAGHKFYGPKGLGLLYVRRGALLEALVHGGSQEGDRRAGTENLPGAAAMAVAAELAVARLSEEVARLRRLETVFLAEMRALKVEFDLNGDQTDKIPGVLNLSLPGVRQVDLVVGMDLAGVAISAGSACSSGVIEPSHVLRAMGLPPWRIQSGIRISAGRDNTEEDMREAARGLVALHQRLLAESEPEGVGA